MAAKIFMGLQMSSDFYVRELSRKDIKTINCWRADRDLVDLLGAAYRYIDISVDEMWYESYIGSRASNIRLAVCRKRSDEVVGVVYLLGIDWVSRGCELAIMIGDKESRGKGLGGFSLKAALKHAFEDLCLHRVHLTVLEKNEVAINLYAKHGFQREGLLRDAVFKGGKYHNMLQMSLLESEFIA